MSRRTIIFRADAGNDSGMGHFMRCLAMAQMLYAKHECLFALSGRNKMLSDILAKEKITQISIEKNEETCDNFHTRLREFISPQRTIVVLDGYHFDIPYQEKIRSMGFSLVYIDDLAKTEQVADIIINPSDLVDPSAYHGPENMQVFCGHKFALLRKSFIEAATNFKRAPLQTINSVFLCFGGSDPENISAQVISCFGKIKNGTVIHFVTSSLNVNLPAISKDHKNNVDLKIYVDLNENDLCELIKSCDVAICSPSTVSQECAAVGISMLCLLIADNQQGIYDSLVSNKLCLGLGDARTISEDALCKEIKKALDQPAALNAQPEKQKKWFDGRSSQRISEIIESL